ncbi:NAD-dependent epimerase/dehydratase family protein [Veronia pacifica]|uniref:Dihydroflavonol 4-reductase n=1 Tax=Veronia pacifica TaxID=1080227 RepID=A0A1C3EB47_9GAMM|nr:NAD-dependent epimerase/dehydratase family protein [Veronia pacifica]ODA30463.1 dihydroflavonol 4-reductase [Veronia pacifica]
MTVLVTGAAGFIGSHIVRQLLKKNYQVRAMHLPNENLANLQGLPVETMSADITDLESLKIAMYNCDYVIHAAAIYKLWLPEPEKMDRVNIQGTKNVLQLAKQLGVKRVVFTSSIARFAGQGTGINATESSPFALGPARNPYPISKAAAHELAVEAAKNGQDVVICAPTGPIGPGDVAPTPTGRFILAFARMPIVAVPDISINFADVRDIAEGHVLAMEKGISGESYLLGHQNLTIRQLAETLSELIGVRKPVVWVPFAVSSLWSHMPLLYSQIVSRKDPFVTPCAIHIAKLGLMADCSKAVCELGLPQSPIKTAVADALIWFAQQGFIQNPRLKSRIEEIQTTLYG